ncbi:MAG TPA: hypothetical protein VFT13_06620 [Candidatus Krumholzibacteria bacterium]|nr:hypothetical protein [Candidatus Krumholzibacteria bacterium]
MRVRTSEGKNIDAIGLRSVDSTLVLSRARYPEYDRHSYPLIIPMRDVESVDKIKVESLVYIETGVEGGKNYGVESGSFSPTILAVDIGYLSGERASRPRPRFGYGATLYAMASMDDFRGGLKVRGRYRFNRQMSMDLAGGPMLAGGHPGTFNGYVASLGVNLGSYVTFKSEYVVFGIEARREYDYSTDTYTYYPGGDERVWYNGIAFRNGAGWAATVVGGGGLLFVLIASLGALAGAN